MPTVRAIIDLLKPISFKGADSTELRELVRLDAPPNKADQIFWCKDSFLPHLHHIEAGTVICGEAALQGALNERLTYIIVKHPRSAYLKVSSTFFGEEVPPPSVHTSAEIDPSVEIGARVTIGSHVVIEAGCFIGDDTQIGPNTVIHRRTQIGRSVKIGANCTIGGVGFGYELDEEGIYRVIPHLGNVVIEDRVEIGNNTAIDRAALGSTLLKQECKIDNLVHIAHGVVVGRNTLVIANALIGGSTVLGDNTWIAPSAAVMNGIQIGDEVVVGLGAVVTKSVPRGDVVVGNPGKKLRNKFEA